MTAKVTAIRKRKDSAIEAPPPQDFETRVRAYVEASTIRDRNVAWRMAETIVRGEIHEEILTKDLERDGTLPPDSHKVLGGIRSNLLRLRTKLGVLETKAKSTGFLGED